ncbi:uncharacterized protein J4E84_006147 [Alternaria hordeiaustralica]|uniref:uncharacterized protein n=1 Tax=Alternaria hordeiaustralica TaxID=1187925 RepID=UPI0020C38638|nr:uncharacterized protein J4E84_006147 [Alternaria hordeiaustralica]KAI4685419.1 hypothetical protein J4E84_006147 [Alternaria hordeiaustralica]
MSDTNTHALCYFMELPTELRLKIYRYVLPEVVEPNYQSQVRAASILRVNHKVNQEASSVLYGETQFHAYISQDTIQLQNKLWWRRTESRSLSMIFSPSARSIRHLTVHVNLRRWSDAHSDLYGRGISGDEYEAYKARDSVRKFINFFTSGNTSLKWLEVRPTLVNYCRWSEEDIIAEVFVVIGPFEALSNIKTATLVALNYTNCGRLGTERHSAIASLHTNQLYGRLREEWLSSITESKPAPGPTDNEQGKVAYGVIEEVLQLIYRAMPYAVRGTYSSIHRRLDGLELPFHSARVAYENGDVETLVAIREAIRGEWVKLQPRLSCEASAISQSIYDMFKTKDIAELSESNPRVVPAETKTSSPVSTMNELMDWDWSEVKCGVPKHGEPGVTIKEDSWRIYIYKGDKMWTRLKTPQAVREAKERGRSDDIL